ncbi:MAG: sigma-70 family RNA polymerase sigma factor [Sulfuritalea sp.]|jgi:RNA polymerase sigma-70 factor (TIGR02943 family)|nr:sigma-70 family RNA polymerase sigma factor [Sulfuritalea sp.]MBK8762627.1 sigma-70 family RNA polymerase sigma factor [Sulfuritalea sp.]MBK9351549.1 sigma-70 family RNA polymerase sigma factor [Sulfuritalea sp.]
MNADRQSELNALRPDLLRFARLQLRDAGAAEDAVQETLLAALSGGGNFESRSSYKTWLIAILRNKIVDIIRSQSREVLASSLAGDEDGDDALAETLFEPNGHWTVEARPGRWADPDASFEQQQFWRVFEACLDHLPAKTARVFMMREILGLETGEICKETGISTSNCWVVLHRARMSLRRCLETTWFAGDARC